MKNLVPILLTICIMCNTDAMPAALCELWKEMNENMIDELKLPTSSREEAHEVLWSLFHMYLYEKENPKDFVFRKTEKTIDHVLDHRLHVLDELARSHGNPCVLR